MKENELITILEKATGASLNEQKLGDIIDRRLKDHLLQVDRTEVAVGGEHPAAGGQVGFSKFLGDVRRIGMGQAPEHAPASKMVRAESGIRVENLPPHIAKDLREGATTAGGYLVPGDESRELLDLVNHHSAIRSLCREVPMRTNQITFPTITGGLTAYWVPEATSTTSYTLDGSSQADGEKPRSEPTFGQMSLSAHVLAVKVVVSNQLLDDSEPQVSQVLMNLFAETIGQYFDIACLRGAGTATDPITGLVSLITSSVLAAGPSFGFDDLADLIYAVIDNSPGAPEVPVIGHSKAEKAITKIKDNEDNYIFRKPSEGKGRPTVWGEPFVRDNNVLTNLGDGGDKTRLFAGDFSRAAFVGNRMDLVIKTNPFAEPYFSYNQTAFLAEVRIGFALSDESRFAVLTGVPTS